MLTDLLPRAWRKYRRDGAGAIRRWTYDDLYVRQVLWTVYEWKFSLKYGDGVDVIDEKWDNLIILDACRFDDFRRENTLDGRLESRISKGVHSKEFVTENFVGRELHDTVYVTGNPFVKELEGDEFFYVDTTPLERMDTVEEGWVRPADVTEAAVRALEEFPNKRLIVHYMQPHDPPIGERGQEIRDQFGIGGWDPGGDALAGKRLMPAMRDGTVPVGQARKAYRENLRIVLDELEELLPELDGLSVLTADHGEMFGERPQWLLGRRFGHPPGPRTEALSKVPWFVVGTDSSQRTIESDPPVDTDSLDNQQVQDQLEALGYK
jgi:hypothetical protein